MVLKRLGQGLLSIPIVHVRKRLSLPSQHVVDGSFPPCDTLFVVIEIIIIVVVVAVAAVLYKQI